MQEIAEGIVCELFEHKEGKEGTKNPEPRIEIPAKALEVIKKVLSVCFFAKVRVEGVENTAFFAKIPSDEDIRSLCRAKVLPISIAAQAISTPFGRIFRFLITMYDDPQHPYLLEAWGNILERETKEDIERLKGQDKVLFLLYDRHNTLKCTKTVTLTPELAFGINLAITAIEEEPAIRFDEARLWAMSRIRM